MQWSIEETAGQGIETDRKVLESPTLFGLTADEWQLSKHKLTELTGLREDLLRALDYFTSHGITCPATAKQ